MYERRRLWVLWLSVWFFFAFPASVFAGTLNQPVDEETFRYIIQETFSPGINDKRLEKCLHYSETVLVRDVREAYDYCVQTRLLPETELPKVYFIWKKEYERETGRLNGVYHRQLDCILVNLTQYEMMSALQRKQALAVLLVREGTAALAARTAKSALEQKEAVFAQTYRATRLIYGKQSRETKQALLMHRALRTVLDQAVQICEWMGISGQQFKYLDYRELSQKRTVVSMTLFNRINIKQSLRIACAPSGTITLVDAEAPAPPHAPAVKTDLERLQAGAAGAAAGLFGANQKAQAQKRKIPGERQRHSQKAFKRPATKRVKAEGDAAGISVRLSFLDASTRIIDVQDGQGGLVEQYALVDWKMTPLDVKTGQPMDTPQAANVRDTGTGHVMDLDTDLGIRLSVRFDREGKLQSVTGQKTPDRKRRPGNALPIQKNPDSKHPVAGEKIPSVAVPERR